MNHHQILFAVIFFLLLTVILVFNHGAARDKSPDHYDP